MRRCLGCMEEYKDEYQVCPYCGYEVGTPPREAYHMVPGSLLAGRYTIGQVLGFGGFGVTYIGYDNTLDRKVAIKEYLPSEFSTRIPGQTEITTYEGERSEQFASGLGKFLDEAKMLAKMQETNGVVQIFNSFKENSTAYIVMEYLEGKTLKTYLEEKGKLSIEEAKEILHPIIVALKDVHAMGIMHRDIAPDNIYLANDGRVKLLDFGASRFATTSHSKSLSVIIKPGFAPVEQYRSRGDQGPWTDVYSLAATMYKMITGITPEDAMERVEKEELQKPSKLGIKIPKNIENALMNALNIKIEDRTQNVEDFERELYHDDKVKLHFVKLKKADVGKWPIWAKVASIAAAAAVFIFGILLLTGVIDYKYMMPKTMLIKNGYSRVPNTVNLDVVKAEEKTNESGLTFMIVDKQYSDFIPKDKILAQSEKKNTIIKSSCILEVVVSGGKESKTMLDVCGISRDEAQAKLIDLGLEVEVEEAYGAYEKGMVMAQSVEPSELVYRGDVIVITVSKGLDTYIEEDMDVEVPNFVGMTMKQAQKAAEERGLYVVKGGTEVSDKPEGTILKQDKVASKMVKQGSTITLIVATTKDAIIYMPDVQYKDEAEAKQLLANDTYKLAVTIVYEESRTVAKGKVMMQSIEPATAVKQGDSVVLIVSSGSPDIDIKLQAQVKEWSSWTENSDIDTKKYEYETKDQYSYRDKAFTDGYSANLDGWELSRTEMEKGDYGDWSGWSTTQPSSDANREITSKTQYSYRDHEVVTQDDNATKSGWTRTKDEIFYKDDYGAWSAWSETAVSQTDTRKVQTDKKTQWRYHDKEIKDLTDTTAPSGYTLDNSWVGYTDWGNQSDWIEGTPPADTDTMKVVATENRQRKVKTGEKTIYHYYVYWCDSCDYFTFDYYYISHNQSAFNHLASHTYKKETLDTEKPLPRRPQPAGDYTASYPKEVIQDEPGKVYCYIDSNNKQWFHQTTTTEDVYTTVTYTVYKTQTRQRKYRYWKWLAWSAWSDTKASTATNREFESRQVDIYRYADRPIHHRYTFERDTAWSSWSDTKAEEKTNRTFRTQTIYKYRDRVDKTHYYYWKWGSWSDYSDAMIDDKSDREIRKRTLYRYRER